MTLPKLWDDPRILVCLQEAVDALRDHPALLAKIADLERRQGNDYRHMAAAQGIVNVVLGEPKDKRSAELQKAIDHYHNETDLF